jgi:hypothetical protein
MEGLRGESLANDGAEKDVEKGLEQVDVEQDKAQGMKAENRIETGANS